MVVWVTGMLLKYMGGWSSFVHFLEKITSCAGFEGSGLKYIFHVWAQSLTLSRSLSRCDPELFLFWTTEKSDVSLAKSFAIGEMPSVKSFM